MRSESVGLMLPPLLAGRVVLASVLVGGIYFAVPTRMAWGVYPGPHRVSVDAWAAISSLHGSLQSQAYSLGLQWTASQPA